MSDGDATWSAIRKNWPILMVVAVLIAGGVRTEMSVASNQARLEHLEAMLAVSKLTDFTRWQVTVERDIQDVKRQCRTQ